MRLQDLGLKTKIVGGGLIPIVLAVVLFAIVGMGFSSMVNSMAWVDQTHRMIRQTVEIRASVMGMLAWLRAFVMTGEERFFTECQARKAKATQDLDGLKKTVANDPELLNKVVQAAELFQVLNTKVTEHAIRLRRAVNSGKGMHHMVAQVASEQESRHFDQFRGLMQSYIDKQQSVLTRLRDEATNATTMEELRGAQKRIEQSSAALQLAQNTYLFALDMETGLRGYLLAGKDSFLASYTSGTQRAMGLLDRQKRLAAGDVAEEKQLQALESSLTTWVKEVAEPEMALRQQISSSMQFSDVADDLSRSQTKQNSDAFELALSNFEAASEKLFDEREKASEETIVRTKTTLIAGIAFVVMASLLISYILARAIVKPVTHLVTVAEGISAGDLSRKLDLGGNDEVGRLTHAFKQMVGYLRDQTLKTSEGVSVLASSAAEISATVAELAASSSKTSSAVAETTTTVEQVKQAAKTSSEKAKKVAEAAQQSVQITETGKRATEDTLLKMNLIKDQMESIGETVVRLSDHSQAIEDIIATVQDLADQSNLLAVNASIEAARAGDQGKGFAVVAQEIKTLADQSKSATEQVRSILQDTRKWVSAVVMATEQGGKAVDAGVTQSASAGESIQSLSDNVSASFQAASLIQSHTEQQFLGVEQVSMAMLNIEQAMKENVSSTSQLENAARRIEQLGLDLKDVVARFKL
jgi:methyl-accepting chemotaxis protein